MVDVRVMSEERAGGWTFRVTVTDEEGASEHKVELDEEYFSKFDYDLPEEFVKDAFEFLLSKEAKESIMASFDMRVIKKFFPEFESLMRA